MTDLSDFKRSQIVGACTTGTSITKTEQFGVAKSTVSKVMTAFQKTGKTSSLKQISGRKRKLADRDRWTLTQIVWKDPKNIASKIIAELNDHLKNQVSSKAVRKEMHKARFHWRTAFE